jgi:hypothetical protein
MPSMRTRVALALAVSIGGGAGTTLFAQIILRATIGTLGANEWLIDNIWPWIGVPVGLGLGIGFLVCFAEPARGQEADLAQVDEPGQEQASSPLVQPLFTASEEAALTTRQRQVALALVAGMQAASGTREDTQRERTRTSLPSALTKERNHV